MIRASLAALLLLTSAAAAERPQRVSRAAQARQAEREADAMSAANPRLDPGHFQFYSAKPWLSGYVLELCHRPGPYRPRPRTCAAAAEAQKLDPR